MHGLAHNLIHKKCAELVRTAHFIHRRTLVCPCLLFAQCKNSLTKQGHKNGTAGLRTILSTEYGENWINRLHAGGDFLPLRSGNWLHYFWAMIKIPLKSRCLHGVKTLAHNLIHIFCAELPGVWKTATCAPFQAAKTGLYGGCLNFNQWHKNDINQCTWLPILRLHTILSTDCVQNLLLPICYLVSESATFLCMENFSF